MWSNFIRNYNTGRDVAQVLQLDYGDIDVAWGNLTPARVWLFCLNELWWYRQLADRRRHYLNINIGVCAQEVLHAMEQLTGVNVSERAKGYQYGVNEKHWRGLKEYTSELAANSGMRYREVTVDECPEVFWRLNEGIRNGLEFQDDRVFLWDQFFKNRVLVEASGGTWQEGVGVEKIFLAPTEKDGEMTGKFAGVMTSDGEYHYGSHFHMSGGYKAKYCFSDTKSGFMSSVRKVLGDDRVLPSAIDTSTGCSATLIVKITPEIQEKLDRNNGVLPGMLIGATYFTPIAQNEDHMLVRMVFGGNTGSERYPAKYFLTALATGKSVLGDAIIGVVSTYGCPRVINPINSTEMVKFCENGIISYGKAGNGLIKRNFEACYVLSRLGFHDQVRSHFNQYQDSKGAPLGDTVASLIEEFDQVGFSHDLQKKTAQRVLSEPKAESPRNLVWFFIAASLYVYSPSHSNARRNPE